MACCWFRGLVRFHVSGNCANVPLNLSAKVINVLLVKIPRHGDGALPVAAARPLFNAAVDDLSSRPGSAGARRLECSGYVGCLPSDRRWETADAILELDGDDVEAIVQVGTNLAMARLAGQAEKLLKKPVLAINTATYWYALRDNGIDDVIDGFGSLLTEFRELPKDYAATPAAVE